MPDDPQERRPLVFEWFAAEDADGRARAERRAVWPGLHPYRLRVWRYGPPGGPWGWALEQSSFGHALRGDMCRRRRDATRAAEAAMRAAVAGGPA